MKIFKTNSFFQLILVLAGLGTVAMIIAPKLGLSKASPASPPVVPVVPGSSLTA